MQEKTTTEISGTLTGISTLTMRKIIEMFKGQIYLTLPATNPDKGKKLTQIFILIQLSEMNGAGRIKIFLG